MIISETFQHDEIKGFKFGYQLIKGFTLFTHIYFVDGLLIDTGQRKVQRQLLKETQDLDIRKIFITHHHEDHTGNIDVLKDRHNCDVFASSACCEIMKNPPKITLAQKLTWGDRSPCTHLIPAGKTIHTPNYQFSILPIIGHAPDMVALYEPNKKWLFSADLYINSYIDYFIKTESIVDQINSISSILKLDFNELFCSHKPYLKKGRTQLIKKKTFLETFYSVVATLYQEGYSAKQIFSTLKLKENWPVTLLSGGYLSKMNMVRSVLRDIDTRNTIRN